MWKEQLQSEARAKIFWGESRDTVTAYLQSQGLRDEEIRPLMDSIMEERAANVRSSAKRNIFIGIGLILVPVVAYFALIRLPIFPVKAFAFTVVVGLFGGWRVFQGTIHLSNPNLHQSDLSEE